MTTADEWLPKDWRRVCLEDGRVMVNRAGELMTLDQAIILRDLLTTSSRPHLRAATTPA